MNTPGIIEIENEVRDRASRIGVPDSLLPTFGFSRDMGYPHVEVDSRYYYYVVVERGVELERRSTINHEELLYWIFREVTFTMAMKFEMENRVDTQDFRRILFKKHVELMSKVDDEFGNKLQDEINGILTQAPFSDGKGRLLT
jgi:hypothetical protein